MPKSGEKGFPRSSPHTVPAIIVIRVSSSLLLTLLTAIPRMLLLVLLRAAYSAPQAPFDIESRNRTRRADPAAINERRRPPAITSRSVNKQTTTTTRRRGNQQSHIKLISTLESQRRNCYFREIARHGRARATSISGYMHIHIRIYPVARSC